MAVVGMLTFFAACSNDDPAPDNGVTIEGIPSTASIDNLGTVGPVTATITAQDGLAALAVTKDGAAFDAVTFDGTQTSGTYDFTYTATAEDEDSNITFTFTATDADGDTESVVHVLSVGAAPTEVIVSENIDADTEWTNDKTYILAGRITVLDGATLTIDPGTVIKGKAGTGSNATALLVARGGKLMAEGTATAPIIFTSVADEITPEQVADGDFTSPNLDPSINGLWGGVILLGKAHISASNDSDEDVSEIQIEGIPTSDPNGLYGGTQDDDNSGSLAYISIRHGGTNIGSGNEINGLSLGGVGTGTSISNIEVVANQDDGIEFFGGTVNLDGILIWNEGDDGLDTDQAWNGTCSNFAIITPQGGSGFELDGPEGTYENGNHTFNGGVLYAGDEIDALVDFDPNTNADIKNLYIFGITQGTVTEYTDSKQTVENWEYTFDDAALVEATVFENIPGSELSAVAENANTVGFSASTDFSWTWASQSGALSDIGLE